MKTAGSEPITRNQINEALDPFRLSEDELDDPREQTELPQEATSATKVGPRKGTPSAGSKAIPSTIALRREKRPSPAGAIVTAGNKINSPKVFLSAEEWLRQSLDVGETEIVVGSPKQQIIRPFTKNLIQAPEKAFKTTFTLRFMLGLSQGVTLFPRLPIIRPRKVLYVHGELSPPEIQERTRAAAQGLSRPLGDFFQGRDLRVHLGRADGQQVLKNIIKEVKPDDLVLDPWQGFITGFDENEFQDVSRATHFMDQLIEEFKITIYLVTHTGKDHSRGTRGHSSLAGWRDTLFKLERKKGGLVEVTVEPRWAAPVEPFNLEFKNGTVWPTEKSSLTPQADKIRKFLQAHEGLASKAEIGKHLDLEGDALRKALSRAEKDEAIVVDGDLVRLPETPEPNGLDVLVKG